MDTLNFATWNATGIMSGAFYVNNRLDQNQLHVLGISEHWLNNSKINFLNSIHGDYLAYGVVSNDLIMPSRRKTGKGSHNVA